MDLLRTVVDPIDYVVRAAVCQTLRALRIRWVHWPEGWTAVVVLNELLLGSQTCLGLVYQSLPCEDPS